MSAWPRRSMPFTPAQVHRSSWLFFGLAALVSAGLLWRGLSAVGPDLISSDYLYLALLESQGGGGFRTPPATYFFPDAFAMWFTGAIAGDPYVRTLYAGYLQLGVVVVLLALLARPAWVACALAIAAMIGAGDLVRVSNHQYLPLLLLAMMGVRGRWRGPVTVFAVFCDPLVVIPALMRLLARAWTGESNQGLPSCITLSLATILVLLFTETNLQLVQLMAVLIVAGALIWTSKRIRAYLPPPPVAGRQTRRRLSPRCSGCGGPRPSARALSHLPPLLRCLAGFMDMASASA